MKKISAVMCTYGRFECVERAMNCFLAQTYPNKELIIYNTDVKHPYTKILPTNHEIYDPYEAAILKDINIIIVNQNIDSVTKEQYTNVGAIRRDALTHANGDYVVTWDDDDVFLPHFMQQAIDGMERTSLPFYKPEQSFFYSGNNLRLVRNTLEASVVGDIKKVREYGYLLETGKEGLGWYTKARDNKELDEHEKFYIPSYCFNWNDGDQMKAPHKQSGDIDNPNNFENHKENSLDRVDGRDLQIWDNDKLSEMYAPYNEYLLTNKESFPQTLFNKYIK
jgi:glycosyltransferase involved in cell wall biosynthesis